MDTSILVGIAERADVERVRRAARDLASRHSSEPAVAESVAIAVSELATNLLRYAQGGEIALAVIQGPRGTGLQVESRDRGPGIADVARALQDGYSSGGGLGSGLPGVIRLMDDFAIASDPAGTRITTRKWLTTQS